MGDDLLSLLPTAPPPAARPGRRQARCRACRTLAYVENMIDGYGEDCAARRGLITRRHRLPARAQDGPDLLTHLQEEPVHRFQIVRDTATAVTAAGIVADGVRWPDGTCSVRWRSEHPSIVFWDRGAESVDHVHGSVPGTRVVWLDARTGPTTVRLDGTVHGHADPFGIAEERDADGRLVERCLCGQRFVSDGDEDDAIHALGEHIETALAAASVPPAGDRYQDAPDATKDMVNKIIPGAFAPPVHTDAETGEQTALMSSGGTLPELAEPDARTITMPGTL